MNSLLLFVNAFTSINLIVYSAILFFRKNNSVANKVFALFIFAPSLNFASNILALTGVLHKMPWFYFLVQCTILTHGAIIYTYINLLMGGRVKWITFLNVVTSIGIILAIILAINVYKMPLPEMETFINNLLSYNYPYQMKLFNIFFSTLLFSYFLSAFLKIKKHLQAIKEFYSDVEKLKFRFLKNFIILLISLSIFGTVAYIFIPSSVVETLFNPVIVNIIYIFIIYYAFHHSAILSEPEYCQLVADIAPMESHKQMLEPICNEIKEIIKETKSGKISLAQAEIEDYYKRIVFVFEVDKLYLDPEITLGKLSATIKACSQHVSMTIKLKFGTNFFDLINSYRIEEAKKMMADMGNLNMTFEGIAFDAGFNSRSAFYRAFKRYTNLTPTEYLNKVKEKPQMA